VPCTVTPIEDGFRLTDGDNGPEIYQRYDVDFLDGLPDTWVEQAQDGAVNPRVPKRGDPFPNSLYAAASCRFVGIESIIDGRRCFMFALFRRGRWGAGGPRKLSRASNATELQKAHYWCRVTGDDGVTASIYTPIEFARIRYNRVEVRWINGDEATINALQRTIGRAVGYVYTIGGLFGEDYVLLGGKAETDGQFMVRIEYEFASWSSVDGTAPRSPRPDVAMSDLPDLGPFEVYQEAHSESGSGVYCVAVPNPVVRTTGTGPALPGI
jgi:hypothetical protein